MKQDERGLPVTTASDAVVDGINRFTTNFMAARDASLLFDLAETHQDCGLLQAYAAALHLYSQSAADIAAHARPYLARAEALLPRLSAREQLLVAALRAWSENDFPQAIDLHEQIAERWPRDIVAAKIAEFLFFQAPDYQRHLRFMERIAPANEGLSHFKAMHAFALELCQEYGRAEAVARAAIELDLYTPWAHHALAHLFLNQGRLAEGIAGLEELSPTWAENGSTIRAHNYWHLALLYLANLDCATAFDFFRRRIWGFAPDDVFEHTDAISLLWRLELAGFPVTAEWQAIAAHIAARAHDHIFPFLTAHYVYALVRAGRADEAGQVLAETEDYAATLQDAGAQVWRRVGLPLVAGCLAFARGDYRRCSQTLAPLQTALPCAGGSDAQNDLFRMTYLISLIESQQHRAAAEVLQQRLGHRQATPLEERWRARV